MKYINTNNINIWNFHQELIDESANGLAEPLDPWWRPREIPAKSLEYASKFFNLIGGKIIVECGSGLHGPEAGDSMLYWFNKTNASTIHCIDLELKRIKSVKNKLKEHPRIKYHHKDCFDIVPSISQIDLIYMDFWIGDGRAREQAYSSLYKISTNPKMILIDDSDYPTPWKHTLIVPEAVNNGYKIIYIGRQTLLVRGDISKKYAKHIKRWGHKFGE